MTGIFSLRRFSSSHFIRALSNIPCLDVWFHSLHTQAVSITIGFHYFYFIFLPCRKCTFRNSNIAQPSLPVQSHFPVPEEFHTFLSKTSLGVHDLLPQACNFFKKEALAQVSSCEFCEISKNTFFFTEHLWWLPLLIRRDVLELARTMEILEPLRFGLESFLRNFYST